MQRLSGLLARKMLVGEWIKSNPTLSLTLASMKIWSRDRQAIFWTFFLPLVLIAIFGVLDFGTWVWWTGRRTALPRACWIMSGS